MFSSIFKICDVTDKSFITFFVADIKFMNVEEFARIVKTVVHRESFDLEGLLTHLK